MISTKGIYHKGKLELEEPFGSDKPYKVIITFVEEAEEGNDDEGFSLDKLSIKRSRKSLENFKGSFSDAVVEERREDR